jgi:hypothetical protein
LESVVRDCLTANFKRSIWRSQLVTGFQLPPLELVRRTDTGR